MTRDGREVRTSTLNITSKEDPQHSDRIKSPEEHSKNILSPKIDQVPEKQRKILEGKLLFNLKITDLTRTDNPFVFYENQQVDEEGYLLFQCAEEAESGHKILET